MRTGDLRVWVVRPLLVAAWLFLAVVAAAVGAGRSGVGHGATPNRQAAARDAGQLLARLTLPSGAVSSSQEPSGDRRVLAGPPAGQSTPLVVDRHAWWRVLGTPDQVLGFINAHAPAGGKQGVSGSGANPAYRYVGFSWPPRPGVLGTRWLLVEVVSLSDGSTGLRADAQVVWIVPRPVSEKVPGGVKQIDVTRAVPGQHPSLSLRVTDSSKVRRIIAMIDRLPTTQPGAWGCPAMTSGMPVVTFSFLGGPDGPALASASELADVSEPTTPCNPLSFSIRGRARTPLLRGAAFLHRVQRLLGVNLASSP